MHVFTRPVETKRIRAVAGMPLPSRFDSAYGRRYLKETFGQDIIAEVDHRHPEKFLELIGTDNSEKSLSQNVVQLKELCDQQAKTIQDLTRTKDRLEKRLRKAGLSVPGDTD